MYLLQSIHGVAVTNMNINMTTHLFIQQRVTSCWALMEREVSEMKHNADS